MGHSHKMWVVLTVVSILTCHLSLGRNVLSVDTMNFSGEDGQSSGDSQLLEPRYSCPEDNVDFNGHDIDCVPLIPNWHACGEICNVTPACKFWTWVKTENNRCCLKGVDYGLMHATHCISGVKGCQ